MKTIRHEIPSLRLLAAICALFFALVLPASAAKTPTVVSRASIASVYYFDDDDPDLTKLPGKNPGVLDNGLDRVFNGSFDDTNAVHASGNKTTIILDFPSLPEIGGAANMGVYISEIFVGHVSNCDSKYSLYWSDTVTNGVIVWNPVPGAQQVITPGITKHVLKARALYLKYVFDTTTSKNSLTQIQVKGWKSTIPAKISAVKRSIFFRGGGATRGDAGFNGGHYSRQVFNGNFNDPAICNMSGTTELVIPTTAPDANNDTNGTGTPWYVTEFKVAHQGNSKYSLYYTTDPEPANVTTNAYDPRTWTPITGASMVEEQSLGDKCKVFTVNKTATAVKYVFESFVSWTGSLAEVEVLAMDPDDLPCTHDNLDLETATYTPCSPATCTENAKEECFCPDCGERFEREVSLSKLGHIYVATLTRIGRPNRYGSGFVSCSRTLEDPDTHETTWSCDFRIDFDGRDVDFITLGGIPINGVVQYTDLTDSSTGGLDGGISPEDVKDNVWHDQWNGYWFAAGLSTNEYVQYRFGTTIELTKIEFSVLNDFQTVYFTKYDPETEEETILKTIPIAKLDPVAKLDEQGNVVTNEQGEVIYENVGYQRQTVDFFVYDKLKKTFVDAIRMRIGDYIDPETGNPIIDPETGETIKYQGTQYGSRFHTCIIEFHPWGTIQYAGLMTQPPTSIMILR